MVDPIIAMLTAAITTLFGTLMLSYRSQISDLKAQNTDLTARLFKAVEVNDLLAENNARAIEMLKTLSDKAR